MNCIIIEDEPLAQEVLENFINRIPHLVLVGKSNNALDAFQLLHSHTVDLMFLDIQMPGINGLDFLRSLKSPPAVIFTTAFAEHAVTGFELEAIDYLLKPINYERFEKAIRECKVNCVNITSSLVEALQPPPRKKSPKALSLSPNLI